MDVWNDPARERFAADRTRLLSQYREHYGEEAPERPGDAIIGILGMLGYPVHRASLPGEQLAAVDLQASKVLVVRDFEARVNERADVLGVLNASLAHELGHIRLHRDLLLARGVEATFHHAPGARLTAAEKRLEAEASCYASVFLVPRRDLVRSPELAMLRLAQRNGHAIPSGPCSGAWCSPWPGSSASAARC